MKYILRIFLVFLLAWSILWSIPGTTIKYVRAQTVDDYIMDYSFKYKVSETLVRKIIKCESGFNPQAHNLTVREDSWGLSQINLKAHKNITKEQATDSKFAVNFLAENLAKGKGKMWTCWKNA